jgi:hypothetical protein
MTKPTQPLRIISVQVENILRAVAIYIEPSGKVIELTGKNRAGKSSTLEAIWMAVGGEKAIPSAPIHDGADGGSVVLTLGDDSGVSIKVTRKFRAKGGGGYTTSLIVENAEGARFQKPQEILNSLIGALSYDPLDFIRMPAKDQFEIARKLVPGVDFDALDRANKADYEKRTEANRSAKQYRAQVASFAVGDPVPAGRLDEAALAQQLEKAAEHNTAIERERARRQAALADADRHLAEAAELREEAVLLRAEAEKADAAAALADKEASSLKAKVEALPALPVPVDPSAIRQKLDAARAHNAIVEKVERRNEIIAQAEVAEAEADALTDKIEKRNAEKRAAIAKAKLPVDGIAFGEGVVLFDGFPISQASAAQQIRVSTALAASLNPRLRFVRVKDASLLDDESWAALAAMAEELDLQIFAETVNSGRPTAVVIEDGHVKHPTMAQAAE